ncbi:hypothetical protein SDC9_84708 [bioreactor metagenome]|uniref:Uncharacterized protein n=1 Tax=bioreactor metagenome TaxID=1076179 RepID=A0A644ZDV6_9ZZZZ|nr:MULTISPECIES: hypothetical protein [Clostridia]EQK49611.1 hypothetical protein C671_0082 [[Clostridium] bifermentans ATCC 19299] [Paraclostridium bifermentans ATCC 19299]MEA4822135.1 hypothetical protein [Erysipelotrichales bacterium]
MNNIGKMTEIDVKCSTIIEILSEVIQTHLLKNDSKDRHVIE